MVCHILHKRPLFQKTAHKGEDAAIYLQEGKNNDRFDTHPTHETIRWYRIVHSSFFYVLDLMVALLLLLLGLTEKPASEKEQEDDLLTLPVSVHGSVEVLLLSLVVVGLGFKLKWQGAKAFFMHKRTLLKVTVLVVMYVEAVTVLLRGQNHVRVTRALRPLFLIDTHYCYGVRRVLRQILLSLPPILDMLFLLFFIMTIFAMLGFYLFSGNEKDEYFTTFWRSFISLFVLLTTANYPDVMMPSYHHLRWSALFFIIYISVVLYFLMNLLLAVVYDAFTNTEEQKFMKLFLHKRYAVRKAHKQLCDENHPNSISWQHFAGLMEFFKSSRSCLEKYLMFKTLNTSHTGFLSLEEFYNVFETSEMKWKKVTEHYNQWYICLKSWKYLYKTVKGIRWLITRKQFEFFIYAVIVLNGISFIVDMILFSNTPQSKRYIQIQELKWYHYIFILVYTAEAFLKIVGFGLRKYFLSGWNVFDFVVTFFGVIGAISPTSFSYIVCIRPFRLLLLFKLKKRYRDVFETVVIVLPRMLRMALVIILLYYSFGIIGIECFSGLPLRNCCPNTSFGAEFEEGGYYYLNHFNDLLHSYVTLFELTVVNNWFIIMEGIVFVTSDWARIYFMSFYIVTMVVMTIIVAFVLEAFLFRMEYSKEHPDNEGEDMHIRKEITISYQELLSLNKNYVEDLQPNQRVKFIGKRPKTKMDLSLKMYKDGVEKWIQSERVVDPGDSSAHMSNKEEAQSIPLTMITANGSGVDMGAGTDSLSVEEMNATADENRESETRI
ncbi:two pore calcium channel protein 1-like isoform X2 [Acropora millepora]|uniref:two pore calcium channel protein 1-like isoform X2 n=1 Tax=Acropora millepora TaxID=45264 RepID=UPI001CF224E9|nr:two pore calcium channel protein 1-like isoform X2 [Acropora millepora]